MSLAHNVRATVKRMVMEAQTGDAWKVLVIDEAALRIISSCMYMSALISLDVTVVENINKKRKAMKGVHAIYMCAPTPENIHLITEDFPKHGKCRYDKGHVYFLSACPDTHLKGLVPSLKHLATVQELNLEFIPRESRVFTLGADDGLVSVYGEQATRNNHMDVATQLFTVCKQLGETPIVRVSSEASAFAKAIAESLQPMVNSPKRKSASQILILDRGIDLTSPLVHELTYQAAVMDLLEVDKDEYEYEFTDGSGRPARRKAMLNEADDIWDTLRHKHVAHVSSEISKRLKEFKAQAGTGLEAGSDTNALKSLLKRMPQQREKTQQFSLHLDMASRINQFCKDSVFLRHIRTEQNIACKERVEGEELQKVESFYFELSGLIADDVNVLDKLRWIMLATIAKDGTSAAELAELFELGNISEQEQLAVRNLSQLGATVTLDGGRAKKKSKKQRRKRDFEFAESRWVPFIKDLGEDIINSKLSTEEYLALASPEMLKPKHTSAAYDDDDDAGEAQVQSKRQHGKFFAKLRGSAPGASSAAATRPAAAEAAHASTDRPRLIIFVLGAIGYNEMRVAYELSETSGWDVYIGSHSIMRPQQFIQSVQKLCQPSAAGEASAQQAQPGQLSFVAGKSTNLLAV
eukprot:m.29808 g.29808  ORF g.29808 m.29808 type:complete len:636 (+) comp9210_c0_seq1:86-1993(+)